MKSNDPRTRGFGWVFATVACWVAAYYLFRAGRGGLCTAGAILLIPVSLFFLFMAFRVMIKARKEMYDIYFAELEREQREAAEQAALDAEPEEFGDDADEDE